MQDNRLVYYQMSCLGCRNYLLQNDILQDESLTIEMKNYYFPIKSLEIKRILRKTINSLVNTRGGAIYLSVDDTTGCVVGLPLSRKDQDSYRLVVEEVVKEFHPRVQLAKEEVRTLFLPVLNQAQEFTGKFVPKIVVEQGDPAQLCTFTDRVIVEQANAKHEYEVLYAYERHPASVKKLSTIEIKEQAAKRAIEKPARVPVHEGCHPAPLQIKLQKRQLISIEFKQEHALTIFEEFYKSELQQLGVLIKLQKTGLSLTVRFEKEEELAKGRAIIENNADQISKFMRLRVALVSEHGSTVRYKAEECKPADKAPKIIPEVAKEDIKPASEKIPLKAVEAELFKQLRQKEQGREPRLVQREYTEKVQRPRPPKGKGDKQFYYVFTHLNTRRTDQFFSYLKEKETKSAKLYAINSVLLMFQNEGDMMAFVRMVAQSKHHLAEYGHNGMLLYGFPNGQIEIHNIFGGKAHQLQRFVERLCERNGVKLTFVNATESSCQIGCEVRDSVHVLDILISNPLIRKEFGQKGSKRKMKFILKTN